MKQLAWILFAVALVLSGCEPADFENPLSDPKLAEIDQDLLGMWISRPEDAKGVEKDGYEALHIKQIEDGQLQIVWVISNNDPSVIVFRGFVTKLSNGTYLNLQYRLYEDFEEETVKYSDTYWIVRYDMPSDSMVTLSYFDDDKAKTLIEKGKLEGEKVDFPAGGKSLRIKSNTSKVVQLIRDMKHEDLFVKHNVYHRIHLQSDKKTRAQNAPNNGMNSDQ